MGEKNKFQMILITVKKKKKKKKQKDAKPNLKLESVLD